MFRSLKQMECMSKTKTSNCIHLDVKCHLIMRRNAFLQKTNRGEFTFYGMVNYNYTFSHNSREKSVDSPESFYNAFSRNVWLSGASV